MSLVSIVLPIYNGEQYLRQALESCLNQTYRNIEILVVDNASTDRSMEIVESYHDSRIRIFRHEFNQGISASTNTGYKNAKGEFITRFAADDIYDLNTVEIMVREFSRHPEADILYSNLYLFHETSGELSKWPCGPNENILEYCSVGLCVFFKRKVYGVAGEVNQEMSIVEDYDFWLRCFLRGCKMVHIDQYLYYFRQHSASITGRFYKNGEIQKEILKVSRRLLMPQFWRYRLALSRGHLRGADTFMKIGQNKEARKAFFWAWLFDPFCFFKKSGFKIFINTFWGIKALLLMSRINQNLKNEYRKAA